MDKYEKILRLIKAVNDKYPDYLGLINIILFDDETGSILYQKDVLHEERVFHNFSPSKHKKSLDDLFIEYGIE